jgi:hypothetical protein
VEKNKGDRIMTKEIKTLQSKTGEFYSDFTDIIISNDNHDIVLLSDGPDKLQQQIVKFILTQIGSSVLFSNYGTNLTNLINNRFSSALINDLKNQITYSLKYVKESNNLDGSLPNIDSVLNINLSMPEPRQLNINLSILLTDGTVLNILEKAIGK